MIKEEMAAFHADSSLTDEATLFYDEDDVHDLYSATKISIAANARSNDCDSTLPDVMEATTDYSAAHCRPWSSPAEYLSGRLEALVHELYDYLGDQFNEHYPNASTAADFDFLSLAILSVCNWDQEIAVEKFLTHSSILLDQAGFSHLKARVALEPIDSRKIDEPPPQYCPILCIPCDRLLANDLCGHRASPEAWASYLKSLTQPPQSMRCMSCYTPVTPKLCKSVLESADMEILQTKIVESYIRQKYNLKHCPQPDCPGLLETDPNFTTKFEHKAIQSELKKEDDNEPMSGGHVETSQWMSDTSPGIEFALERNTTILRHTRGSSAQCKVCRSWMCVTCGSEDHLFLPCEMHCDWINENKSESQTALWLLVHTKNCPNCSKPIEKNQGCMHMTCKCGHQFCWLCLGDWKNHSDAYRCNFYAENGNQTIFELADNANLSETDSQLNLELKKRIRNKSARFLSRYNYYFGRYISHHRGAQMTELSRAFEAQKDQQANCYSLSEDQQTYPLAFFDTMESALKTITYGRNLIKLTYVFGYYARWKDHHTKNLFEDQQGQMERALDLLQESCEQYQNQLREMSVDDLITRLRNLSRVVTEFLHRMKDAFSTEFITTHSLYQMLTQDD